ncbi:MAG: hypothetical protein U0804_27735 [Gemmataceae bacterium]
MDAAHRRAAAQTLDARSNADAMSRDPARFTTVLGGSAGIGGVYDWWRLKALVTGRRSTPRTGGTAVTLAWLCIGLAAAPADGGGERVLLPPAAA